MILEREIDQFQFIERLRKLFHKGSFGQIVQKMNNSIFFKKINGIENSDRAAINHKPMAYSCLFLLTKKKTSSGYVPLAEIKHGGKEVNNKETGNTLLAIAGAVSAGVATWGVIHHMEMQKRKKERMEENIEQKEECKEKEKLKEQFLHFFELYEEDEFESFSDFWREDGTDLRECAADYYAEGLYPYIKENMKMVPSMEGDDGKGQKPFIMTDELFYEPACLICRQPCEDICDGFRLAREMEIWLLESGKFVVVTCIYFEKDGWQLTCRFQDRVIQKPSDIPITLEDLELELSRLMWEKKE